jgi:hypothetical protein
MRIWRTLLLAAVVLLTGCASLWRVQSDVQSFSSWPQVPQPPTYFRFERLPSQLADPQAQAALEQQALPALAQVGLLPDPQARYSLQISTLLQESARWDEPVFFSPWIAGYHGPRAQVGLGFPVGRMPQRGFQRQVSLLLRDLASGQVVYETHARYDSRFTIGTDVLPAMVAAALHGFPQPPTGPRIVTIELPH